MSLVTSEETSSCLVTSYFPLVLTTDYAAFRCLKNTSVLAPVSIYLTFSLLASIFSWVYFEVLFMQTEKQHMVKNDQVYPWVESHLLTSAKLREVQVSPVAWTKNLKTCKWLSLIPFIRITSRRMKSIQHINTKLQNSCINNVFWGKSHMPFCFGT